MTPGTASVRVLFVTHDTSMFGAQRVLLTLLENIDRRMITPYLLVPYYGPMVGLAEGMGIPVFVERMLHWIPGSSVGTFRRRLEYLRRFLGTLRERCRAIEKLIRDQGIDLVYTNTVTCVEGAIAARWAGIPHIWHIHEHIRGNRDLSPLAPGRIHFKALDALSDRVIFCSRALADGYPSMPGKTSVVYNGMPLEIHRDRRAARMKLSRELGLGAGVRLVAVVGGLQPGKDLPTFLAAGERVNRSCGETVFLIVGTGPDEYVALLRRKIGELGLESNVVLLGWREDVQDILAAIDVLAISSERESFGLTAVEAMAVGTPVVATRCGGPEEVVIDGETGFLVPMKDPGAMADAISALLRDADLAGRMGEAGIPHVRERFGTERFVRSVEQIIMETGSVANRVRGRQDVPRES